jgi:hypothetical protein
MARKATKRRAIVEELDGPTPAQLTNGDYHRDTIIHADNAQRATVHINRGGTPVMRWWSAGRLNRRQLAAIEWMQRLWHIVDTSAPVAAQYGERVKGTGNADLAATKWLAASIDLRRISKYVSGSAWRVFENVCRFGHTAGMAGEALGYGSRSAEVRAHTLVCEVADMICEREGI